MTKLQEILKTTIDKASEEEVKSALFIVALGSKGKGVVKIGSANVAMIVAQVLMLQLQEAVDTENKVIEEVTK